MPEENSQIQINIPWDKITAGSFALSLLINAMLIGLFSLMDFSVEARVPEKKNIPIELLQFGMGEKKRGGGNLTKSGKKSRGRKVKSPLQDAKKAPKPMKVVKTKAKREFITGDNPVPTKKTRATKQPESKQLADAGTTESIGNGAKEKEDGAGLGNFGSGKGSGLGYGPIEWGNGGNRVVLSKVIPRYPRGVRRSAQIKIQFTVRADGTVGLMIPLQKGEPLLEKAAMDALRKWRFNPVTTKKNMKGVITFTFRLT